MIGILITVAMATVVAVLGISVYKYGFVHVIGVINGWAMWIYHLTLKSWLRDQIYVVPDVMVFRDALMDLNLCTYISKMPTYRSRDGDLWIVEFNLRLQEKYTEQIEISKAEIEQSFREVCVAYSGKLPQVYVKELSPRKLIAWISQNRYGDFLITEERSRNDMEQSPPEEMPGMRDLKSRVPIVGFDMQLWNEKGVCSEICIDVRKFPGMLISGPSGSGKSVFMTVFLSEVLAKYHDEIGGIYYLDFKSASESRYLLEAGYSKYFCGEACAAGLEEFYEIFRKVRESGSGNDPNQKVNLLIFDEAASFLLSEQTKGREGKALADKHTAMLTEVGLLGRSFKCGIWLVAQQPSAEFMKTALRESLHSKVCFLSGGFSAEMRRMIGVDEETAVIVKEHGSYGVGSAIVLRQGKPAVIAQVPYIEDITVYQKKIVDNLPSA